MPTTRWPVSGQLTALKGFLFDLDGVLWQGARLIPGVKETLSELRRRGKHLMFISNTSSRSRQQCLDQFAEFGLHVESDEIFLASEATAQYIAAQRPGARTYVVGNQGLMDELLRAGLDALPADTRNPEGAEFVVVGKDNGLDFTKLTCALRALRAGAKLVAVNNDMTVPADDGLEPGAGAIAAAITAMTGHEPDTIGKPGPMLLQQALTSVGLTPPECVMIGDTLEADIAAGNRLGMKTILVFTGNTNQEDLTADLPEEWKPDFVLDTVSDLLQYEFTG